MTDRFDPAPSLPDGYAPLPFDARRGLPQTAPFDVAAGRVELTLVSCPSDLPALLAMPPSAVLFDLASTVAPREGTGEDMPLKPQDLFQLPPTQTLTPPALRIYLIARQGQTLLSAQPVLLGRALPISGAEAGFLAEVYFAGIRLTAGSFVGPGDFGARIVAGARERPATAVRASASHVSFREELYATLT